MTRGMALWLLLLALMAWQLGACAERVFSMPLPPIIHQGYTCVQQPGPLWVCRAPHKPLRYYPRCEREPWGEWPWSCRPMLREV